MNAKTAWIPLFAVLASMFTTGCGAGSSAPARAGSGYASMRVSEDHSFDRVYRSSFRR